MQGRGNFNQTPKVGGEFGLSIFKKFDKRFYLQTGVLFIRKRYNVEFYNFLQVNGQMTDAVVLQKNRTTDISIPILINYRLPIAKKVALSASVGAIPSWSLKNVVKEKTISKDSTYYNEWSSDFNSKGVDKVYLNLGLGVAYYMNEKFSLMVTPTFFLDLKNSYFRNYTYTLRTLIIYNFSKI